VNKLVHEKVNKLEEAFRLKLRSIEQENEQIKMRDDELQQKLNMTEQEKLLKDEEIKWLKEQLKKIKDTIR
jgi:hypothetical protein